MAAHRVVQANECFDEDRSFARRRAPRGCLTVQELSKQKKPVHLLGSDGSQGEIYFSPKIALHVALSESLGAMVTKTSNTSLDGTETLANSIYPQDSAPRPYSGDKAH